MLFDVTLTGFQRAWTLYPYKIFREFVGSLINWLLFLDLSFLALLVLSAALNLLIFSLNICCSCFIPSTSSSCACPYLRSRSFISFRHLLISFLRLFSVVCVDIVFFGATVPNLSLLILLSKEVNVFTFFSTHSCIVILIMLDRSLSRSFHIFSASMLGQLIRSSLASPAVSSASKSPRRTGLLLLESVAERFPVLWCDCWLLIRLLQRLTRARRDALLCALRLARFLTTSWSCLLYSQAFEVLADLSASTSHFRWYAEKSCLH